jgi:S-DNA-T family DNA segregation ATPase FtsK/SpoIIIE
MDQGLTYCGLPQDNEDADNKDDLYTEAFLLVVKEQRASVTLLQRRMKIGYMRADLLMRELERNGVVEPFNDTLPRKVLIANTKCEAQK